MSNFFESYKSSLFSLLKFLITNKNRVKMQSAINKFNDVKFSKNNKILAKFQNEIFQILKNSHNNWKDYDYGQGYYYQGLNEIGISGLRDTNSRFESMNINDYTSNKNVLEIGCNTGFLSNLIAKKANNVCGFDINPYLIKIAKKTCSYLNIKNVEFYESSFENFKLNKSFDVVISFSNHSTYDGNTKFSIEQYFKRCHDITSSNGYLLFESHPPIIEKGNLDKILKIISNYYEIVLDRNLSYGTKLDANRKFVVAKKHN